MAKRTKNFWKVVELTQKSYGAPTGLTSINLSLFLVSFYPTHKHVSLLLLSVNLLLFICLVLIKVTYFVPDQKRYIDRLDRYLNVVFPI